jgi:hypothetical protein
MADENYAAIGSVEIGNERLQVWSLISKTSAGVRFNTGYAGGNADVGVVVDRANVSVAIFR